MDCECHNAPIAQLEERRATNAEATSSSLVGRASLNNLPLWLEPEQGTRLLTGIFGGLNPSSGATNREFGKSGHPIGFIPRDEGKTLSLVRIQHSHPVSGCFFEGCSFIGRTTDCRSVKRSSILLQLASNK